MNPSSSDSSDSDSENYSRLREAAVGIVLPVAGENSQKLGGVQYDLPHPKNNSDKAKCKKKSEKHRPASNIPSLRPVETFANTDNELNTTPEFRAHVAKKLAQIVDRNISTGDDGIIVQKKDLDDEDEGFLLFTTSRPGVTTEQTTVKRRTISSSSSSSDDEKFASVAVSGDLVLSQGHPLASCLVQEGTEEHKTKKKNTKSSKCKKNDNVTKGDHKLSCEEKSEVAQQTEGTEESNGSHKKTKKKKKHKKKCKIDVE